MTRATNAILSVLSLGSGALMVAYALTADVSGSAPETVTLTVRGAVPVAEQPIAIRDAAPSQHLIPPFRIALESRRPRR